MKVAPFHLDADSIRATLEPLRQPVSVALVGVGNPFNVGALVRVAHSFLVREVFLLGCERWYERAAMGMDRYETLTECPTEEDFLARTRGRTLVGVERERATVSLWHAPMPEGLVFLFGGERTGVPESLLERCAHVLAIPMYGINHSYPVPVAAGMVLLEWARRRDPSSRGGPTP